MVPAVKLASVVVKAVAAGVICSGKPLVVIRGIASEPTGITHGTDDCSTCFANENGGVAQWEDAGIFVVRFCPSQIGQTINKLLCLLGADPNVFAGLLRFALGKKFLSLRNTALLSENLRFPFGLLCFEVLRNVSSSSALHFSVRMLEISLEVARHLHVLTLRSALVEFFEGFPFHLGIVSAAEVVKVLPNAGRIAQSFNSRPLQRRTL